MGGISIVSRPVRWLLSTPSNCTLLPIAADAVDLGGQRALGVEELGVRRERAGGARHQVEQRLEAAVVARRQVGQLRRFDFAADVGAVRLQNGGFRGDFDGLGDLAGL